MYIVTKNNPYYPVVDYCETMEQARAIQKEFIEEMSSVDGEYVCKVTIAQEIDTKQVMSDY